MPIPHLEIRIVQRSKGSSAIAGAAYQAGEKLFSEYDQKSKDHRRKQPEVVYTEIMLPTNAPPEYADRATLWNSAEEVEKQWNSQLARRFVLALPREVPLEMCPQMMQEYCREHFVSKGMCCDFAIHDPDPPGNNPHCHIMLTMRAIDQNGKWMPKTRKVYDLDENGERIKLPSGRWKSHKENTVDWNEQYHAEEWRHGWEVIQNKYLELSGSAERVDMRSYERQGVDVIPTVHMGAAVSALERKGIETNIGNLNRDIKAANRMMNAIRSTIKNLRNWIAYILEATKEAFAEMEAEKKNAILTHVNKTYTMTESAKELNLKSATELNKILADKHIQYKVNNTWVFYSDYSNLGYEDIKQEVLDNGHVIYHRKITQMGRAFILGLFKEEVA